MTMKSVSKFTTAQKNLLQLIEKRPLLYNIKLMKPIHPSCDVQYRTYKFLQTNKLIELKESDDTFQTFILSDLGKSVLKMF